MANPSAGGEKTPETADGSKSKTTIREFGPDGTLLDQGDAAVNRGLTNFEFPSPDNNIIKAQQELFDKGTIDKTVLCSLLNVPENATMTLTFIDAVKDLQKKVGDSPADGLFDQTTLAKAKKLMEKNSLAFDFDQTDSIKKLLNPSQVKIKEF
ncbi:hypothetical protein KBD59_04930 [Candidatus Gracilibacteria bacterium]|nr:hypothetical protein [Candidatus Gracilibacteria bacterium]